MKNWKRLPIVNMSFVVINVLVYLVGMCTRGLPVYYGRMDVQSVLFRGEYWRIVTAMFLHGSVDHLFSNMLVLFFLGAMIEQEIGHICYGIVYLLSGIGGNLVSLYMKLVSFNTAASLGASGVVFGMDGVLLALVLFSNRKLQNISAPRVFLMIALSLYSGFVGSHIDNAAHVGGLVTGFVLGSLVCIVRRRFAKQ